MTGSDHSDKEFRETRNLYVSMMSLYELGMDYLQLLYLQPIQKLPIPLLVSEERNTSQNNTQEDYG